MIERTFGPVVREHRLVVSVLATLLGVVTLASCGARGGLLDDDYGVRPRREPQVEVCNGLDDDLDGFDRRTDASMDATAPIPILPDASFVDAGDSSSRDAGPVDGRPMDGSVDGALDGSTLDAGAIDLDLSIDEDFRDSRGRYISNDHCGVCGNACRPTREHEVAAACGLIDESPTCVATQCEEGFVVSRSGRCVPSTDRLCLACADDGECGDFEGARCGLVAGESRCTVSCTVGCPRGYDCQGDICIPSGGSCSCNQGQTFDLACPLFDPNGNRCAGSATCNNGLLSECAVPVETCDEVDEDCDGVADQTFKDARGIYSVDLHNCGACGVDCSRSTTPEGSLVCGGDPLSPSCVLRCPDTEDGIQVGDRIDADRNIATGCECRLSSLSDEPGPVRTTGELLDVNCDGADGMVVESIYVAPDGLDTNIGSPTRPLRTIQAAIDLAARSRATAAPRLSIYIASGVYTESIVLIDGVKIFGGYRRDFLSLDPNGFVVELRAPTETTAPSGAAVVGIDLGQDETILAWLRERGRDAIAPSEAAFGAYFLNPGPNLLIRDSEILAGTPGAGFPGDRGVAGGEPQTPASPGEVPRAALEGGNHRCINNDQNVVRGGAGSSNSCNGADVSGGAGGDSSCPNFASFQGTGASGRDAPAAVGGSGGSGGQDSQGPIMGVGCPGSSVCCGLADFTVPTDFVGPQPGRAGSVGRNGTAGNSCSDALGTFDGDRWIGAAGTSGSSGSPGSGGGGGGAGGGTEMDWINGQCQFPDGLGGGGGGGGGGGCGGNGGAGATSGGPSIALVVRYTMSAGGLPRFENLIFSPASGAQGGDGGAGGDGGRGSAGALGGSTERSERTTPTLAGPFPGGRGGQGGTGGSGGGGGAGCGGSSVGIWVTGDNISDASVAAWRGANSFSLGLAGRTGRGGGGAAAANDGEEGTVADVLVR